MENKKYLDKVVGSLVRSTKIDYENDEIHTPFSSSQFLSYFPPLLFSYSFTKYCKYTYGLTDDEIEYVWNGYRYNILDKINQQ